MADLYRVILEPELARQLHRLDAESQARPGGAAERVYSTTMGALVALRRGEEADFDGERLGYSPGHADLRDCAEIKVALVRELTPAGRERGPSHRITYREFEGTADDPRPIRQVIALEPRKNGRIFEVTANRLDRPVGQKDERLAALPNVRPAIGPNKDPNRPVGPQRLPLPPEIAAALSTTRRRPVRGDQQHTTMSATTHRRPPPTPTRER